MTGALEIMMKMRCPRLRLATIMGLITIQYQPLCCKMGTGFLRCCYAPRVKTISSILEYLPCLDVRALDEDEIVDHFEWNGWLPGDVPL